MINRRFILFVLFCFLTISPLTVLAQENTSPTFGINYEEVNPDSGFYKYGLKRIREKIALFALSPFSSKKADYYREVADRRLYELVYIVDKDDRNNIERGSLRYFSVAGQYVDYLNKRRLSSAKESAKRQLEKYLDVLEELANHYDGRTAEWRFIKHDIDYINTYIENLSS